MNRRALLAWAALALLAPACARSALPTTSAPSGALPDGLYPVRAESPAGAPPAPAATGERTVPHDPRLADAASTEPASLVTLGTTDYVPLVLSAVPTAVLQPDGRTRLDVALAPEHAPTLEAFTRRHLGARVALVLDGEVVSLHKLKAVITDGRMMITRCTDRACDTIRSKLVGADDPAP